MTEREMRTYRIRRRPVAGSRVAGCAEVACEAHVYGWRTRLAVADPGTAARVAYVEHDSGRRFLREDTPEWITFTFPAGQACFTTHYADAELAHIVADRRGLVVTGQRTHSRPELWAEDFAENQDWLAQLQARG